MFGIFIAAIIVGLAVRTLLGAFHLEKQEKCDKHSWHYVNDHLVCKVCKKTPEETCGQ